MKTRATSYGLEDQSWDRKRDQTTLPLYWGSQRERISRCHAMQAVHQERLSGQVWLQFRSQASSGATARFILRCRRAIHVCMLAAKARVASRRARLAQSQSRAAGLDNSSLMSSCRDDSCPMLMCVWWQLRNHLRDSLTETKMKIVVLKQSFGFCPNVHTTSLLVYTHVYRDKYLFINKKSHNSTTHTNLLACKQLYTLYMMSTKAASNKAICVCFHCDWTVVSKLYTKKIIHYAACVLWIFFGTLTD